MKRFLIFVLFFLPFAAHAQAEAPQCYPFINGVHTIAPRHFVGEQGQHVFWQCSPRGGTPKLYGFSCLHGQCSMAVLHSAHSAILAATAKVAAANALWAQHVTFECGDVLDELTPRGNLCRERAAFVRVLEARR